jgi:hypothetical protein
MRHDGYNLYARLIATLARREGLLPFRCEAVARVIEHSARLADIPAGLPDEEGNLPEGSINWRVAATLYELSVIRQEFAMPAARKKRKKDSS